MSAEIIDGKKISQDIKDEVKQEVASLKERGIEPCLAVVLVGDDPASHVYVRNKIRACEYTGIKSVSIELPADTEEDELLKKINELNADESVHGILVQLPLPPQIDEDRVINAIDPDKDVDGFSPISVGRLSIGLPGFKSCTPAGIIELIKRSGVSIDGKNCCIVGRSNIVGKPMAMLLLRESGTVTVCHSHTKNLRSFTSNADILVAAIGKPKFFKADDIKEGATVIDVGMDRDENGKLCGDVDFESASQKAGYITPVPGGVGPMTIAMLMKNCVEAAKRL
ncbi:MAG TPA: bifunctional methylenetetrahydrofolate dehydrogenase/methenyltetrahydrofolate cyclohydrolase FolD [Lachnospiraceae bacterium]|nr:bifunctional methylenetetrahydrofolate dehydrogenase/methenyltetrahydrofolate cyclohydrolase FolD [Lachnospiraceae bacterium]